MRKISNKHSQYYGRNINSIYPNLKMIKTDAVWRQWLWQMDHQFFSNNGCGANPGGGVLQEKLGMGVRSACQNPYPIYDQNLRFSLFYLWPDQKFDTLFMTWLLLGEQLLLLSLFRLRSSR